MRKALSPALPQAASTPVQREFWSTLDALALCRKSFGLTPASLGVLRALISFLPKGASGHCPLVVWPSNRTLCERADGMDERTLRRHLDRLIRAGLIARRASSNGKRFALRRSSEVVAAFGFDLGPLLDQAEAITAAAEADRAEAEECARLRVEILTLMATVSLPPENEAELRRSLRRRTDAEAMRTIAAHLQSLAPQDLTASDRHFDRQLQNTEKDSESVPAPEAISLTDCLDASSEGRSFSPEPVRCWDGLVRLGNTLAPMIGITPDLARHARSAMGPLHAALAVLCIVQQADHVRQPAAYLRKLALLAEQGRFSIRALITAARNHRFAAANQSCG